MEEIKILLPYFVKFKKDNTILLKKYSENCAVEDSNQRPIIMITHDKNIFFANNSCQIVWTFERYEIFYPKRKRTGIMVLDFLFPWSWLNLLSLLLEKQQELASSSISLTVVTYFKYDKIEEGYWTGKHLLD